MTAIGIILTSALVTAAVIKAFQRLPKPRPRRRSASCAPPTSICRPAIGREALDKRLVTAANAVCGAAADVDLAGRNDVRLCRKDVLAQARAKTDAIAAGRTAERTILIAAR